MTVGLAAFVVAVALALVPIAAADGASYDLTASLQSWTVISGDAANVEAVWRIENRGTATSDASQATLSSNPPATATLISSTPACVAGFAGFYSCPVPALASGASFTLTTRVHVDNTTQFLLQIHAQVGSTVDANSANDDAVLAVVPPSPGAGGSGGTGPGAGASAALPTATFGVPRLDLVTPAGRCRVVAPQTPLRTEYPPGVNPNDYQGRWIITYPDATTDDIWPSLRSTDGTFPVGMTQVKFALIDKRTSTPASEASITIDTRDRQAPRLARAPADITVKATSKTGTRVTFRLPATLDNCPGVKLATRPASGARFPVGTTTVSVTATDAAGNRAKTSFRVTVRRP